MIRRLRNLIYFGIVISALVLMTLSRSLPFAVWTLSVIRSASSIPWTAGSSPHFGLALHKRQSGIPPVPSQCASTCDPVNVILQTDTCPPSTCCTTSFQMAYFQCLECVFAAANATTAAYAQGQTVLDNITVSCFADGFPLPELTLPGQNPNRSLSTSLGTQSSVKSNSQITVSTLSASPTTMPQRTVTALSTQPSATQPSSTSPSNPTTSPNAAMSHSGRFDTVIGLISAMLIWIIS
ncbi:hypothetical protein C8R45DRAFT_1087461 [Mycena sanguinolenta]|nr:hypothetical protein C8R45DRAFT_1087461 [Mycena sanguinolenta]